MNAPADYSEFREVLDAHRNDLPKRLRQCAAYFDAHPERVAFDTVAQVAVAAEVHPSAVVRFAKVLGFTGYSDLQAVFRAHYTDRWPDYPTRLARIRREGAGAAHNLLQQFARAGERSLARMLENISEQDIDSAVKSLSAAPMVHIVGFRRSFPVAAYLVYAFEKQGQPCRLIDGAGLLRTGGGFGVGDRLLAISVAPYTQQTVDLARQARAAGTQVVAISDAQDSPLFALADHRLEVREEDVGDFRTLAATFALATTLAVAVGAERT